MKFYKHILAILFIFSMNPLLAIPNPDAMPVTDWGNYIENLAIKKRQILQYKKQLEEFELLQKNSTTLSQFSWDDATTTINNLINTVDSLDYYKQQAGGLTQFLNQYQSSDYYSQAPCFKRGNCSAAELKQLEQQAQAASIAEKRANDALFKGIDNQQTHLKNDAARLKRLQQDAETADGQTKVLEAANELSSASLNQLLQIRGLMIAEQSQVATRAAVIANREAMQEAADANFRAGSYKANTPRSW